jgi:hypothetical protein
MYAREREGEEGREIEEGGREGEEGEKERGEKSRYAIYHWSIVLNLISPCQ